MSKLARAMGITEGAVRSTVQKDSSPIFDQKLTELVRERRRMMSEDERMLCAIEQQLIPDETEVEMQNEAHSLKR